MRAVTMAHTGPVAEQESWTAVFGNRGLATAFDGQAAEYARLRPGYPAAAVDAAVPPTATRVLDLGAGTGKLTASLLDRGSSVVAVEPLWGMVAELHRLFPPANAVAAAAEQLPLADGTVDAIVVGQAFHWFDPERALDEMARVLRPAGSVSLLWNHDDEADPLVRDILDALDQAGRPGGGSTGRGSPDGPADHQGEGGDGGEPPGTPGPAAGGRAAGGSTRAPFVGHRSLTDPVLTEVAWIREQPVEDLIGLLHTYSYVIRASDALRSELDSRVRDLVRRYRPGRASVTVPVICQVWRSTCR